RTWLVAMSAIAGDCELAARLVSIMAYLAPDSIPVSLLGGVGADEITLDDALTLTASYSLIARNGDDVSIHRLVQAIIRASHVDTVAALAALDLLLVAQPAGEPETDVSTWPAWSALAPHIESLARRLCEP